MFVSSPLDLTFVPSAGRPSEGELVLYAPARPARAPLSSDIAAVDLGRWLLATEERTVELRLPGGKVQPTRGLVIRIADALGVLSTLQGLRSRVGRPYPASLRVWSFAEKLALELASAGYMLPTIRVDDRRVPRAVWAMALVRDRDRERYNRLAAALPASGLASVLTGDGRSLLRNYLDAVADTLVRRGGRRVLGGGSNNRSRRNRTLESRIVRALTEKDNAIPTAGYTESSQLVALAGWSAPLLDMALHPLQLRLQLEEPEDGGDNPTWRLEYALVSTTERDLVLDAREIWEHEPTEGEPGPLDGARIDLLRGLGEAARVCGPIEKSLHEAEPTAALMSTDEAWRFVSEQAPILARSGFQVVIPEALRESSRRHLRPRIRILQRPSEQAEPSEGVFRLPAVTEYRWEVALGDEVLTHEEFEKLVADKAHLVRRRGKWATVDPTLFDEALAAQLQGSLPTSRALTALAAGEIDLDGRHNVEVVADGNLVGLMEWLTSGQGADEAPEPSGFVGELRPYQKRGLGWLATMEALGIGACLADEMGLGKTVQIIALLLQRRAGTLVVCPTSVIGNWGREVARFAPDLPLHIHHGPDRTTRAEPLERIVRNKGVVITNYALVRRDQALLEEVSWERVVLDEAQSIKNVAARQTRAVKGLLKTTVSRTTQAVSRLALTGTPLENRLTELWSILDFCNPGLLGSLTAYKRKFAIPIERWQDDEAAARLHRRVQPFLLRRLKSDSRVSLQLPEKNEINVICTLTREQATLYQAQLNQSMTDIASAEGIARRGRVLALITALKQICNHPGQFLGDQNPEPKRSGKMTRLLEMLEVALSTGDRALVFTQYREMGNRLYEVLQKAFPDGVEYLHGGVPAAQRDRMTQRFQEAEDGARIMILSLKAGGLGLNLSRASHVFHYDRWWNPAVEDQATDRAHRIGQTKPVQVYKLIAAGTLEEGIAELLESKRGLADKIIGSGERWLTELNDEELRELVQLAGGHTDTWDEGAEGELH